MTPEETFDIAQKKLNFFLSRTISDLERKQEEVDTLRSAIKDVQEIVEAGRWWELASYLEEEVIESLCECEPVDRKTLIPILYESYQDD